MSEFTYKNFAVKRYREGAANLEATEALLASTRKLHRRAKLLIVAGAILLVINGCQAWRFHHLNAALHAYGR